LFGLFRFFGILGLFGVAGFCIVGFCWIFLGFLDLSRVWGFSGWLGFVGFFRFFWILRIPPIFWICLDVFAFLIVWIYCFLDSRNVGLLDSLGWLHLSYFMGLGGFWGVFWIFCDVWYSFGIWDFGIDRICWIFEIWGFSGFFWDLLVLCISGFGWDFLGIVGSLGFFGDCAFFGMNQKNPRNQKNPHNLTHPKHPFGLFGLLLFSLGFCGIF